MTIDRQETTALHEHLTVDLTVEELLHFWAALSLATTSDIKREAEREFDIDLDTAATTSKVRYNYDVITGKLNDILCGKRQ